MSLLLEITEGWTAELGPFVLAVDGVVQPLGGMTVELFARPEEGSAYIETSGDVRIDADPSTGKVYFKPDATDFRGAQGGKSYALHWKVTDGLGDVVFFPNGAPDTILVHKV